MPSTVTLSDDGTIIAAHVSGDVTLAISEQILSEILALVHSSGVRKVLVDVRTITAPLRTLDLHSFGSTLGDHAREHVSFAVVASGDLAPHRFVETVAVNRGAWYQVFDDLDVALEWLQAQWLPKTP
jgi:hypothetical protein